MSNYTTVKRPLLKSTFTRSGKSKRGKANRHLNDLEEFDFLLGRFPRRNWSPTEIEMENSTILKFSNKSFDHYFYDMKKRNYQKGLHTANTGLTYKI